MRRWHWGCPKCQIADQEVEDIASSRAAADEHDREHHNGRPVSSFGFTVASHRAATGGADVS